MKKKKRPTHFLCGVGKRKVAPSRERRPSSFEILEIEEPGTKSTNLENLYGRLEILTWD